MKFSITGRHMELTDPIKKHARDKTEKFSRYYDSIKKVEVVIEGNQGNDLGVEIIVTAEHGKVFVVNEHGSDAYACMDAAAHKLERQLRKAKEKERNRKHAAM